MFLFRKKKGKEYRKKVVLMNRRDGLGERLCAMMNALRLADALGHRFAFSWESDVWNPVYHQLDISGGQIVRGHSITPVDKLFSPRFIKANYIADGALPKVLPFSPQFGSMQAVRAVEEEEDMFGWEPDQHMFSSAVEQLVSRQRAMSYPKAFLAIEFASSISKVIDQARSIDLGSFDALHLRSGDMVYGQIRKWGHWSNKVLNPSVAGDLIAETRRHGRRAVLFGQDVQTLEYLRETHGAVLASDLTLGLSNVEQAMFDIVLMSRAERIIAGNSGFSRAACMAGGKALSSALALRPPKLYAEITLEDLAANASKLNPMMVAYSYWQVFAFYGRQLDDRNRLLLLELAEKFDPENLLYPIIRASLLYRIERDIDAESLIHGLFERFGKNFGVDHPVFEQLNFKYYSTPPTHTRQFRDFIAAAERPRNTMAKLLAENIEQKYEVQ